VFRNITRRVTLKKVCGQWENLLNIWESKSGQKCRKKLRTLLFGVSKAVRVMLWEEKVLVSWLDTIL
jgi:hypothetical protein